MVEVVVGAKVEDAVKMKTDIDTEANWLRDGESIEVIYGEFWEAKTKRKDEITGNEFETDDFKIGGTSEDGKHVFRLVNKYVFSDIIGLFQSKAVDGKLPKTVFFEKPFFGRSHGGQRGRGRRY
jgi:hypothetical protein